MMRRAGVASVVCLACLLATVRVATAATIWSFKNADATDTPVSGYLAFGNLSSSAPGTTWQVSDVTDFAINYDGSEIASFANPQLTTFFSDAAGIPILEFTATTPFLPFVSTDFGLFRSLLLNVTTIYPPPLIVIIEGSPIGETFLDCITNLIPGAECNGASQDLVPIVWSVTSDGPSLSPQLWRF